MTKAYTPPRFDIGQLLRQQAEFIQNCPSFTSHQKRMLKALADCRTAALGAHKLACTDCGTIQIAYNSCRNRNCPKCQNRDRQAWLAARQEELLPVPYFHLVFTLPSELNELCLHYPKVMYGLLFKATWYTVNKLGKDKRWVGAQLGMIALLHTWGSNLSLHPHLHCMVPAGGLDAQCNWKSSKSKGNYLFNRSVMGKVFRARYVKLLRKAIKNELIPEPKEAIFKKLFDKEWITYAKRPFAGPQQVLNYIGRYSHKVAITNHRILDMSNNELTFSYKNYRKGGEKQQMTLTQTEFIRRFSAHIIPHKFVRIRHYGILSNRNKKKALIAARKALRVEHHPSTPKPKMTPLEVNEYPHYCSCCQKVTTHLLIDVIPPNKGLPRGSPTPKQAQKP